MGRTWTNKEKQFLEDNRNVLTNLEISRKTGRTLGAVQMAISKFGFHRDPMVVSRMQSGGTREDNPQWKGGRPAAAARHQASHREELADRYRNYADNNPEKRRAKDVASCAVKSGKLKKQPCEWINENGMRCGETKNIQMHHEDYSKELEVICYCPFHHRRRHTELKRKGVKNGYNRTTHLENPRLK